MDTLKVKAKINKALLRKQDLVAEKYIGVMVTPGGNMNIHYNVTTDTFTAYDENYGNRTIPDRMILENAWIMLTGFGYQKISRIADAYRKSFPKVLRDLEDDMNHPGESMDDYDIPPDMDDLGKEEEETEEFTLEDILVNPIEVVDISNRPNVSPDVSSVKADIVPEEDPDILAHNKLEAALKNIGFSFKKVKNTNPYVLRAYFVTITGKPTYNLGVTDTEIVRNLESYLSTAIGIAGFDRVEGEWPSMLDAVRFTAVEPDTRLKFQLNADTSIVEFIKNYK